MSSNSFDLDRFVDAQTEAWPVAERELRAGAKRSHWMWMIFPQIEGLGRSATARHFAIAGAAEARAYLDHPLLGERLRTATRLMLAAPADARTILGDIDAMKFRSSMTLFDFVAPGDLFVEALARFHAGERDPLTIDRLTLPRPRH